MKRPQYVFRPNLNEPQHRRAWALLQQVPPAKRKEFLVQSILAAEQTDRLEKSIRKVVREELQAVNMHQRWELMVRARRRRLLHPLRHPTWIRDATTTRKRGW